MTFDLRANTLTAKRAIWLIADRLSRDQPHFGS
jgi:hypothetical protein